MLIKKKTGDRMKNYKTGLDKFIETAYVCARQNNSVLFLCTQLYYLIKERIMSMEYLQT